MLVSQAAEGLRRRGRLYASFVIVTVVFATAGCVRGGPAQETTTDELTTQGASAALFEVATSHPDYWRLFTLDRVDGTTWMPAASEGVALSTPATLPGSPTSDPASASISHNFRILSDFDVWGALPIAPTASELDGPVGSISWDQLNTRVIVNGGASEGMEYTVRSAPIVPTPEELDRTSAASSDGRWTELPADLDPRFERMAERWTAGAASDYRKVLAIQERFQLGDFAYSTDVPPPDGPGELLEFLTRSKVGFCEHYSSAMAVLVRSLGIPARIAAGFRVGTLQDDGSYLVQGSDVHVWVEVRFAGYGWLPFEPEHGATHPYGREGTYLNP
jgi:transglutaminase-like putative cysteine protease